MELIKAWAETVKAVMGTRYLIRVSDGDGEPSKVVGVIYDDRSLALRAAKMIERNGYTFDSAMYELTH